MAVLPSDLMITGCFFVLHTFKKLPACEWEGGLKSGCVRLHPWAHPNVDLGECSLSDPRCMTPSTHVLGTDHLIISGVPVRQGSSSSLTSSFLLSVLCPRFQVCYWALWADPGQAAGHCKFWTLLLHSKRFPGVDQWPVSHRHFLSLLLRSHFSPTLSEISLDHFIDWVLYCVNK